MLSRSSYRMLSPRDVGLERYSVDEIAKMMLPVEHVDDSALYHFAIIVSVVFSSDDTPIASSLIATSESGQEFNNPEDAEIETLLSSISEASEQIRQRLGDIEERGKRFDEELSMLRAEIREKLRPLDNWISSD